jgi:hypothetical protein
VYIICECMLYVSVCYLCMYVIREYMLFVSVCYLCVLCVSVCFV